MPRKAVYPCSRSSAPRVSSPSGPQRVAAPTEMIVSESAAAASTSFITTGTWSRWTLISTMADRTRSPSRSSRIAPVATSLIRLVTGFFCSKCTPSSASRRVTRSMSAKLAVTPGRPNSTVIPHSPTETLPVTSFVLTSSVPRPWTPVASWETSGSLKARRTTRGHASSSGSIADVGQMSGSGSKRSRTQPSTRRMVRMSVGFSRSVLSPR